MNTAEIKQEINACINDIAETEKKLVAANEVLDRLHLRSRTTEGVAITLGGVAHQVTTYNPRMGVMQVVQGMQDLHQLCIKLQRDHILRLKSRIEGMAFKVGRLAKQLSKIE